MQTRDLPTELLLPPKRLGNLLAEARVSGGYSLSEASDALGSSWSSLTLLEIETGRRPVLDQDLRALTDLYDIETSELIPERSHLVVDVTEGTIEAGNEVVRFESSVVQRRDVLAQYLAMIYSMRDVKPGQPVPLRLPDLEILEGVLGAPRKLIESELRTLMTNPGNQVGSRVGRLKGRLLIPAIGVVVAATAVGALLLVGNDSDAAENPVGSSSTPTTAVETTVNTGTVPEQEPEIGDAVVQERLPDGSPGPVTPRD